MTNNFGLCKKHKLQLHIGRAKDLFEKGNSIADIAKILKVPEVQVREYKEIIDKAEENR